MTHHRLLAAVLAAMLLLSACGDDGSSDQSGDGQSTTEQESDGTTGDGGDLAAAFTGDCSDAVNAFTEAVTSVGAAFVPGQEADLSDAATYLDEVADAAPDEISGDFQILADAFAEFAQALEDAGIDFSDPATFQDPEAIAALEQVDDAFDDAAVSEASDNIDAWFQDNCDPVTG